MHGVLATTINGFHAMINWRFYVVFRWFTDYFIRH
jgi:hypothetical protein